MYDKTERGFSTDLSLLDRKKEYESISKLDEERFIETYCVVDINKRTKSKDLYQKYVDYMKKSNKRVESIIKFNKTLKYLGYEIKNDNWKLNELDLDNQDRWKSELTVFGLKLL